MHLHYLLKLLPPNHGKVESAISSNWLEPFINTHNKPALICYQAEAAVRSTRLVYKSNTTYFHNQYYQHSSRNHSQINRMSGTDPEDVKEDIEMMDKPADQKGR